MGLVQALFLGVTMGIGTDTGVTLATTTGVTLGIVDRRYTLALVQASHRR